MRKFKLNDKHKAENSPEEDLGRYKDFGKLMTNYEDTIDKIHRKPLYKSKKGFLILIVLLLLLIAFLESQQSRDESQQEDNPIEMDANQKKQ